MYFLLPKLPPHFCGQMSHLDSFSKAQDGDYRFLSGLFLILCLSLSCSWVLLLGLDLRMIKLANEDTHQFDDVVDIVDYLLILFLLMMLLSLLLIMLLFLLLSLRMMRKAFKIFAPAASCLPHFALTVTTQTPRSWALSLCSPLQSIRTRCRATPSPQTCVVAFGASWASPPCTSLRISIIGNIFYPPRLHFFGLVCNLCRPPQWHSSSSLWWQPLHVGHHVDVVNIQEVFCQKSSISIQSVIHLFYWIFTTKHRKNC